MLLNALTIGLTVADLDMITIGMLNDLAIEYVRRNSADGDQAREATQDDYDRF